MFRQYVVDTRNVSSYYLLFSAVHCEHRHARSVYEELLKRFAAAMVGRHVVYCTAGSQTPSSFLKCSAPGFLDL